MYLFSHNRDAARLGALSFSSTGEFALCGAQLEARHRSSHPAPVREHCSDAPASAGPDIDPIEQLVVHGSFN